MFGEVVTIDELFEKLIITQLDQKEVQAIKKYFEKPEKQPEISEKKEEKIIEPENQLSKEQIQKKLKVLETAFKYKPSDILKVRIGELKLILETSK